MNFPQRNPSAPYTADAVSLYLTEDKSPAQVTAMIADFNRTVARAAARLSRASRAHKMSASKELWLGAHQ